MILPIYAGLERLPDSLLEASPTSAPPGTTFRPVVLPLLFPAIVAGSIFTFSLSLGDYIAVQIVGGTTQMLGNVVYDNVGAANNLPFAAAVATIPVVDHGRLPARRPPHRRPGQPVSAAPADSVAPTCSLASRRWRWCSSTCRWLLVVLNSFNADRTFAWPPPGFTLRVVGRRRCTPGRPRRRSWTQRQGGARRHARSRWCSARWPPSRCSGTASSAATRSRCWSSCRSRCPASSPASR